MFNGATTLDAENLFKAVVSGKRINFPVTVRSRNTFKCSCSVTTTSVTPCTSVGTGECTVKFKLEVGLRLLRLGIRICGLTNGAFTSSTSCSAHGYTGMRLNPFAFFIENGQKATWIFSQFGRSQTDRVQGKSTHCEWSHFHIARVCFPTGTLLHPLRGAAFQEVMMRM